MSHRIRAQAFRAAAEDLFLGFSLMAIAGLFIGVAVAMPL